MIQIICIKHIEYDGYMYNKLAIQPPFVWGANSFPTEKAVCLKMWRQVEAEETKRNEEAKKWAVRTWRTIGFGMWSTNCLPEKINNTLSIFYVHLFLSFSALWVNKINKGHATPHTAQYMKTIREKLRCFFSLSIRVSSSTMQ